MSFLPSSFLTSLKRWGILFLLSATIIGAFLVLHLSAGMMLGPMIAGIIMSIKGKEISLPRPFFIIAQAILACLVVNSISYSVLHHILQHWILVLFSVFSVITVSFGTGAGLAWFGVMPGTTALWGTAPGAASTMTMLCSSFGADSRLTAFMLYFRVIMVSIVTSIVASFVTNLRNNLTIPTPPHGDILPTITLIISCTLVGMRLKMPAAALLLTITLGATAQLTGTFEVSAPLWLRIPAYLIIGWTIGLRFTKPVLHYALRSIPAVMLSSLILIAACALLALPVAHFAHIDLLSAYLATSPGGLDTIIIISANTPIALPFIIAMQTARMIAVVIMGPTIARPLGRLIEKHTVTKHNTPPS